MTPAEIAAYIGAAAWLPQIVSWIYRRFVTPFVTIVPERYAEVGFTSYGPIFNVRMAFSADRKDVVIDGFGLVVTHDDGDSRTLRWAGLSETFSEIRDEAGNRQIISKDQVPIAIKVGTASLVEKFVRFQEPRYHEATRPQLQALAAHFKYLKRSDPNFVANTLASKEFYNLAETRKNSFWWKPGRYEVRFVLSSSKKLKLSEEKYEFDLTALDVEQLKQNIDMLEKEIGNVVRSNLPNFLAEPIDWNWANVEVVRKTNG